MSHTFAFALSCLVVVGCDHPRTDPPSHLGVPDLSSPPVADMTVVPDFSGIQCGDAACKTGPQVCCVTGAGSGYTEACTAHGACASGSTPLACDGPEDCPGAGGGCCVALSGTGDADAGATSGQGAAACATTCTLKANIDSSGTFSAETRLCHVKADCAGLIGTVTVTGLQPSMGPFDSCCTQAQAGPYTFCAPSTADGLFGVSCPPSIN